MFNFNYKPGLYMKPTLALFAVIILAHCLIWAIT